jgi:hypothetical protein
MLEISVEISVEIIEIFVTKHLDFLSEIIAELLQNLGSTFISFGDAGLYNCYDVMLSPSSLKSL